MKMVFIGRQCPWTDLWQWSTFNQRWEKRTKKKKKKRRRRNWRIQSRLIAELRKLLSGLVGDLNAGQVVERHRDTLYSMRRGRTNRRGTGGPEERGAADEKRLWINERSGDRGEPRANAKPTNQRQLFSRVGNEKVESVVARCFVYLSAALRASTPQVKTKIEKED